MRFLHVLLGLLLAFGVVEGHGLKNHPSATDEAAGAGGTVTIGEVIDLGLGTKAKDKDKDKSGRRGKASTVRRGGLGLGGGASLGTFGSMSFQGNFEEAERARLGEASFVIGAATGTGNANSCTTSCSSTCRKQHNECQDEAACKYPVCDLPDFSPDALKDDIKLPDVEGNNLGTTWTASQWDPWAKKGYNTGDGKDGNCCYEEGGHKFTWRLKGCATVRTKSPMKGECSSCHPLHSKSSKSALTLNWRFPCIQAKASPQIECYPLEALEKATRTDYGLAPHDASNTLCAKVQLVQDWFRAATLNVTSDAYKRFQAAGLIPQEATTFERYTGNSDSGGHFKNPNLDAKLSNVVKCLATKYTACRLGKCAVKKVVKCVEVCKSNFPDEEGLGLWDRKLQRPRVKKGSCNKDACKGGNGADGALACRLIAASF